MKHAFVQFLFALVCCDIAHAQSWNPTKQAQVASAIAPILGHTPSLVIGVGINGNLVMAQGFGSLHTGAPPDRNTVYHIGSVTKQFTAAAVLSLVDQKATVPYDGSTFSLSTQADKFFTKIDHWGALNIRDLLTMSSGIPNFTATPPLGANPFSSIEYAALRDGIKSYSRSASSQFSYSNSNYFLLAAVIDVLRSTAGSAKTYNDYIRAAIFVPAGMTKSTFINDYVPGTIVAAPTYKSPPAFAAAMWPRGAGDIASTVEDIHKWNTYLLSGSFVSAGSKAQLFSQSSFTGSSHYGMGWFVNETPVISNYYHSGQIAGYTAFNGIVRRKADGAVVTVTILTNSDNVPGLESVAGGIASTAFE